MELYLHQEFPWNHRLVLPSGDYCKTDFNTQPWKDGSLVTPRHAVRQQWNDAAIRKYCQEKKRKLFKCPAEDRISERKLNLREWYGVAARNGMREKGD